MSSLGSKLLSTNWGHYHYLQAVINLAKGFRIIPEIGVADYGSDRFGKDEGHLTYFGAKWQIIF